MIFLWFYDPFLRSEFVSGFPFRVKITILTTLAATMAKAFVTNVVYLHGIPTSIASDHDKVFLSFFWQALFQL